MLSELAPKQQKKFFISLIAMKICFGILKQTFYKAKILITIDYKILHFDFHSCYGAIFVTYMQNSPKLLLRLFADEFLCEIKDI